MLDSTVSTRRSRRRPRSFQSMPCCSRFLLLIVACLERQGNGAFLTSTTKRYPSASTHNAGPLYAQKREQNPYRLGVYPYLDHTSKRKQIDKGQHRVEDGGDKETTYTTLLLNTTRTNATATFYQDALCIGGNDNVALNPQTTAPTTINATNTDNTTTTTTDVIITATNHSSPDKETTVVKRKPPSSLLSPQPFFSTWSYDGKKSKKASNKNATTTSAEAITTTSSSLIPNRNPTDVLTVGDLQQILQSNGYVRQDELLDRAEARSARPAGQSTQVSSSSSNKQRAAGGSLAFPQQSVLSYRDLTFGSTVSAGLLGMLVAISIVPNLWLVGSVVGSVYGFEVAKRYSAQPDKPASNVLSRAIISMGRRLAKSYLAMYDFTYGIWFMYKTGQLSYDYYKQYSKLDQRFGIQEKMDAWNARFVQGKKNFDAWEQDNEIGRRVLASFRTAWLVEEKRRKQTQYRVVQYFYDVVNWCKRFLKAIWSGDGDSALTQVLKGIRVNISESRAQEIGPRIGAAIMALLTVTMIGSLYAIAPRFLGLVAIAIGVIFPTWVSELWDRLQLLMEEFAATGRGEDIEFPDASGIPTVLSQQFGLYDKKRYSFYRRDDGSRRWYRTGQPAFRSDNTSKKKKKKRKK